MPDYWGRDLPVNLGQNNFDKVRYEYFRDRQVAFEAFKSGVMNYHEEFTSRTWATATTSAFREGRVKREVIDRAGAVPTRAGTSTPAARCSRTAASARRSGSPSISNGRTRTSCSASTAGYTPSRTRT